MKAMQKILIKKIVLLIQYFSRKSSRSCMLYSTTVVILFVIALKKEFPQLNPDLRKQCQTAATALTKLHLLDAFEYEDHGNMGCQVSKGGIKYTVRAPL